jgi:hypothetical protein
MSIGFLNNVNNGTTSPSRSFLGLPTATANPPPAVGTVPVTTVTASDLTFLANWMATMCGGSYTVVRR